MTTLDNRTEAERRYDAERDGTLYFRQLQPAAEPNHLDLMIKIQQELEADNEPEDTDLMRRDCRSARSGLL
jgi:hypothetical protein